jgi:hypothetical protein
VRIPQRLRRPPPNQIPLPRLLIRYRASGSAGFQPARSYF